MSKKWGFWLLAACLPVASRSESLLPVLTEAQTQQARKLLRDFKANPKGPYFQIRWYCNDGTVLPPAGTPCKPQHGGGNQHAELSPAAKQLAGWNIDVDTILTGLSFEEFFDAKRDHHRLKELVIAKYLEEVDQGWIYRRAVFYRGARQVEDEEKAGRRLLVQLLSDPAWVGRNYFLASQLVAAVPHGAAGHSTAKIRTAAKSVADQDRRFEALRAKIHSSPGLEDLKAVEKFAAEHEVADPEKSLLANLINLLKEQETSQGLAAQLPPFQKRLAGSTLVPALNELAAAVQSKKQEEMFSAGAALCFEIRKQVLSSSDGRRNLDLMDLAGAVLENGFRTGVSGSIENPTRRRLVANLVDNFRYAYGAGLLSLRELEALRNEAGSLEKTAEINAEKYHQSIAYLALSTEWCRATAAKDFGPVMRHYLSVEPAASGLVDHLVRGSVALALSNRVDVLVADANRAAGIRHSIFGETSSRGITGVNPGVAVGKLGIVNAGQEDSASIDPQGIYVIPETVADLAAMAGILTLDSGNALSHTQLLAANLGIPNATVPSTLLPQLKQYAGRELFFAVTPRRVVVLQEKSKLSPAQSAVLAEKPASNRARMEIDIKRINLSDRHILELTDLSARDAGVRAGPKAANLAQLAHFFPENVAPGLVVPFGIYQEHIARVLDMSGITLEKQITDAYTQAERMRESGTPAAEINKFIYPKLAKFRQMIQTMAFLPQFEKELPTRMQAKFGPEGSYGVFVRSDTNAEDLPQFTGAGLNLTVPNQVGYRQIEQSIRDVWASPFTERAYDWRSRVLKSSEHVYPSVVLLRTVRSDISGVIGTMNLETGDTNEITVNVNEGISAVVDGGVAESLLLKPNGEARLLAQARAPYRKVALAGGDLENQPASGNDHLLTPDEISQLRTMVAEVKAKYPVAQNDSGQVLPWDIEFGFEGGKLRLFQIRPLARFHQIETLTALSRLEGNSGAQGSVRLDQPPQP